MPLYYCHEWNEDNCVESCPDLTQIRLVSPSQINTFYRCGYVYLFRYTDYLQPGGVIIPPGTAAIIGSSFHSAQEHNFASKLKTKEDVSMEEILDVFSREYDERISGEVFWTSVERSEGKDKLLGKLKDVGYRVTEHYMTETAPSIVPHLIEQHMTMPIEYPDGMGCRQTKLWRSDFGMHGYIDLIDSDRTIVDYKTSSRKTSEIRPEHLRQLLYYAMMFRHTGEKERAIRLDYVVKTKTPQVVPFRKQVRQADIEWASHMLNNALEHITKSVFVPNIESYLCSPDWCGYYQLCPATKYRR